jgi:hypothetical protein
LWVVFHFWGWGDENRVRGFLNRAAI